MNLFSVLIYFRILEFYPNYHRFIEPINFNQFVALVEVKSQCKVNRLLNYYCTYLPLNVVYYSLYQTVELKQYF